MILSTCSFAVMNAMIKYLIHYDTFQLVFFRSIGSLVFTFSYLLSKKIPLWGNQKKLLIYRGLFGVTSMSLYFASIHYISIGSAVTLRYLAPIFAAFMAVLFLKERIKPLQWVFFLTAFSGVAMIKGFDSSLETTGLLLVLLSAVFTAVVYILISKIGKGDHPVVVVHYFMLTATLVGGLGTLFVWKTPKGIDLLLLLSLGVFGYLGQVFMTKAFQNAEAYMVAPFKYVEVVFTLSFGVFLFQEFYSFMHLLGTFLVIFGLALNVLYKARTKNK